MENDTTAKKLCRRVLYGLWYTALGGMLVGILVLLPMYTESLGIMGHMNIISKWWHLTLLVLGALAGIALLALLANFIYSWAWGQKEVKNGKPGTS